MPLTFLDARRGESVEDNSNRKLRFRRLAEHAEAFTQKFPYGKVERPSKFRFAQTNIANSGQRESADLVPIQIEREEIPKVFHASQVVWLDEALLVAGIVGFLVVESHLELFKD